jgi:cohesin loading factor subunit SCC2
VLPELPGPGPPPHAEANTGSTILYHQALINEATQLLSLQNESLSMQVASLISNTSVDYVELINQEQLRSLPPLPLVGAVYQKNPTLFGHVTQQWSQQQSYNWANNTLANNAYGRGEKQSNDEASSFNHEYRKEQQQDHRQMEPNASAHNRTAQRETIEQDQDQKPSLAPSAPANDSIDQSVKKEGANESKPLETKPKNNHSIPVIKLTKLSKEAGEMMQKSVQEYKMQTVDVAKAEQMGVYDNFTPRSRRARDAGGAQESDDCDEDDEDEDDGDSGKKSGGRNKFFKASEKQRDEEKRRLKDVRKRRAQNEDGGSEFTAKRRRQEPTPTPEPKPFVPKKVTRTLERNLVPMIPKISIDEEDNTFQRFNKAVEVIFDNMEEINLQELEKMEEDAEIPPEFLIPKYQLSDLAAETAKLKSLGVMESISAEKLVKLLNILELNIRDGSKVTPLVDNEDDEGEDKLWVEMAQERVVRAGDASLAVLNVLTSKNMSKKVFIDDVIDRVAIFLRFQLSNTIYPSYDPVYKEMSKSKTGYVGSMKKKRSYAHGVRDRNILSLYNKTHELVSLMADLVKRQLLTDTTILHISTLGITPFFVENVPELQLAALRLVTNLFSRYEKHRKLLLDDILASIARLPSSKRSLRSYRLNATTHIQMLTALVLQLIQCVVVLPKRLSNPDAAAAKAKKNEEDANVDAATDEVDRDVLVNEKYKMAMATAHQFITVFLMKCGSKNEDVDYRPLFENFVQDLLTTVNIPEWPAAELLLTYLGHVLRQKFSDRSTEMALRISSLEYLGVVAARLRKDAVQSRLKEGHIASIVRIVKEEEEKEGDNSSDALRLSQFDVDASEERNIFLQRVLLDFLAVNGGEEDQAVLNARHFYICQWYRDVNAIGRKPKTPKKNKAKRKNPGGSSNRRGRGGDTSSEEESSEEEQSEEEDMSDSKKSELYRLKERRKDLLLSKIPPFGLSRDRKAQVLSTHIDHDSAHLIVKYLSSKRPFFNSFNSYLKDILNVLTEQSTHIRTKALKCMTMIVMEDPDVLLRENMRHGVSYSFMDPSTMVREAAVDLVGKFILHKQDLIEQYYDVITARILVSAQCSSFTVSVS